MDSSSVAANSSAGGIAGYLGKDGTISGDKIVMNSTVTAIHSALGGIVGTLDSGKVMYNWAYTVVSGDVKDGFYMGPIVGKIQPGAKVPPVKYTVKYNRYRAGTVQTETYEGYADEIEHEPESLTATEMNPVNAIETETPSSGETEKDKDGSSDITKDTSYETGATQSDDKGNEDSGGGGCSSGLGIFGLVLLIGALGFKKFR